MSSTTETLAVRTSSALLIGAIADENSLLEASTFESNFIPLITSICQDFNWEVRKEICGQLPFISKYLGSQKSYSNLYPELIELIDDEEREVASTAIQAFGELVEQYLNKDSQINDIMNMEEVRPELVNQFIKIITEEKFIGKIEISRTLLQNCFWIATQIDLVDDTAIQRGLLNLIAAWLPGVNNRYHIDDEEKSCIASALQNLTKLYKQKTIPLYYTTLYENFIATELSQEKSSEGVKMELAEVFPSFIENIFTCNNSSVEE